MSASWDAARIAAEPATAPVRVMIVDDSLVIRRLLTRWFEAAGGIEVVAAHGNGRRAAEDVARSQPDVVILDIEMPEMDGLTALPLILARKPGTMVIVASTLSRRGAEVSLRALTLGAADYLTKPDSGTAAGADQFREDLLTKVRHLATRGQRRAQRPRRAELPSMAPQAATVEPRRPPAGRSLRPHSTMPVRALLIGSSTGGPQALTRVFADIGPAIGAVPVLVTQHMPPTFTAILAEHIGKASGRVAAEGVDGEPLQPGRIYVAPGGKHMLVAKSAGETVIRLSDGPPVNFCRPAVDPLFESASGIFTNSALAVVLTGMGSDGAKGASRIAEAGGSVIAQDEATSIVWGMPGATVAAGACSEILPLGEIGPRLTRILTRGWA